MSARKKKKEPPDPSRLVILLQSVKFINLISSGLDRSGVLSTDFVLDCSRLRRYSGGMVLADSILFFNVEESPLRQGSCCGSEQSVAEGQLLTVSFIFRLLGFRSESTVSFLLLFPFPFRAPCCHSLLLGFIIAIAVFVFSFTITQVFCALILLQIPSLWLSTINLSWRSSYVCACRSIFITCDTCFYCCLDWASVFIICFWLDLAVWRFTVFFGMVCKEHYRAFSPLFFQGMFSDYGRARNYCVLLCIWFDVIVLGLWPLFGFCMHRHVTCPISLYLWCWYVESTLAIWLCLKILLLLLLLSFLWRLMACWFIPFQDGSNGAHSWGMQLRRLCPWCCLPLVPWLLMSVILACLACDYWGFFYPRWVVWPVVDVVIIVKSLFWLWITHVVVSGLLFKLLSLFLLSCTCCLLRLIQGFVGNLEEKIVIIALIFWLLICCFCFRVSLCLFFVSPVGGRDFGVSSLACPSCKSCFPNFMRGNAFCVRSYCNFLWQLDILSLASADTIFLTPFPKPVVGVHCTLCWFRLFLSSTTILEGRFQPVANLCRMPVGMVDKSPHRGWLFPFMMRILSSSSAAWFAFFVYWGLPFFWLSLLLERLAAPKHEPLWSRFCWQLYVLQIDWDEVKGKNPLVYEDLLSEISIDSLLDFSRDICMLGWCLGTGTWPYYSWQTRRAASRLAACNRVFSATDSTVVPFTLSP